MPLSPPKPRNHFHTRQIRCDGYARPDGLWEIEATITDTKTYGFPNEWRGEVKPGEPIHGMSMRIAYDDDYVIREAEAAMDFSPFETCATVAPNFAKLVGLKIGPGFNRKVKELVGGTAGCTHLVELLAPMATVAFQTTAAGARRHREEMYGLPPKSEVEDAPTVPRVLDSCVSWDSRGPNVKKFMPEYYRGDE
jgi:hypothetical protein